ncbi:MAG: GNAT family N-acetyltransferase [Candidatus Coprovivens sp.]
MINIRLSLNENLKRCGGNIGYSIRPTERQKGYNKINLYLGLKICLEYGINKVYLDCNKDNLGSKKTIESLGGILEYEKTNEENEQYRRYIINVEESIKEYNSKGRLI